MKLLKLKVQNIMALEAFEVKFTKEGAVTIIEGKNNIGKSTALNSLAMALGGKRLCPDEPLRYGQETGYVEVDLGEFYPEGPLAELHVKRVFGKGEKLIVTDAKGFKSNSPQAILDKLYTGLSFDPLAFANMSNKEQVKALKELAGIDFTEADKELDRLKEARKLAKRDLESVTARLEALDFDPDAPDEEVDVNELLAELDTAQKINQRKKDALRALADWEEKERQATAEIARLEEALAQAKEALEEAKRGKAETDNLLSSLPSVEEAPIRETIAQVQEVNRAVIAKQKALELAAEVDKAKQQVESYNKKIKEVEAWKKEQIARADLPVEGLTFDEEGARWNGTLIPQLAFSKRLYLGTVIALARKPVLPVMLIDQGSELDDESLKMIARLAGERGAQVLMTRTGTAQKPEVHFIDTNGTEV